MDPGFTGGFHFEPEILYTSSIIRLCKGMKEGVTISANSLLVIVDSGKSVTCLVMDPISKPIGQITSKRLPSELFLKGFSLANYAFRD